MVTDAALCFAWDWIQVQGYVTATEPITLRELWASNLTADGRLTARPHEASKSQDPGLDFSSRFRIMTHSSIDIGSLL